MPGGTTVSVHMLDDTINAYEIKPSSYGNVLLQAIMKDLDILESDYFGAYYDHGDGLTFLDPLREIGKQIKKLNDTAIEFGVKFFTPDPSQMQDEYTRYLFALQVKRDINTGALVCAESTNLEIASYIVQAEFGDWNAMECSDTSYLNEMKIFPNPTSEQLQKILELHRNLIGKKPAEADYSLLDIARRLELYGVRLYPALDAQSAKISLGVSHAGVLVFQGKKKINNFNWSRIRKLSFKRKRFLIKLRTADSAQSEKRNYGDILIFVMNNRDACKNFWKLCLEHHAFFRLEVRPKVKPKPVVLSRGSSFHYNGKTQKELLELVRNSNFRRTNFVRTTSRRRMHNSVSSPTGDVVDAKKTRPDLGLQNLTINQSNNVESPSGSVASPSVVSTYSEDQGSYKINDTTRSVDTESSITTTANITPDHSQRSPEWQLESKSLHSSATPIEGTKAQIESVEAKGKSDFQNYARMNTDGNQCDDETDSKIVTATYDHSSYAERMRLAFKNSQKNDSHIESFERLLRDVTANDRESIISNTSNNANFFSGSKSLSFDPLSYSARDSVPPLPPKERQLSNEDGSYDNLKNVGTDEAQDNASSGYVSSSGFQGMGDSKNDPFVNDSVVNLAAVAIPMTPEVKAKIGEQKIKTGHYAVPKKPPAPPEGESFNSPRWNRTSQILDKEINEAMTQLYKAINDSMGGDEKVDQNEHVCVDSDLPVVISSSEDENDFEVRVASKPLTPLSPEEDPLLAPIEMKFDDADTPLVSSK